MIEFRWNLWTCGFSLAAQFASVQMRCVLNIDIVLPQEKCRNLSPYSLKKGCPKAPYPLEKVPGWQIAHDEEFTASAHKTKRRPAVKVLGSVPTVQYRRPVQPSLAVHLRRFRKHAKWEQYYPMLSRNIQGGMKCKTMPSSILEPHALRTDIPARLHPNVHHKEKTPCNLHVSLALPTISCSQFRILLDGLDLDMFLFMASSAEENVLGRGFRMVGGCFEVKLGRYVKAIWLRVIWIFGRSMMGVGRAESAWLCCDI